MMRVTALHTYTHPPERVILIACLTFTAIGTRQIVAQLAVSTSMQTALTLVHVYKTHENGKETEKKSMEWQWQDSAATTFRLSANSINHGCVMSVISSEVLISLSIMYHLLIKEYKRVVFVFNYFISMQVQGQNSQFSRLHHICCWQCSHCVCIKSIYTLFMWSNYKTYRYIGIHRGWRDSHGYILSSSGTCRILLCWCSWILCYMAGPEYHTHQCLVQRERERWRDKGEDR